MNVLFIMYDQLRHDYLGCAGHPSLKTPQIDRLASMGVRFTNAHVQSPVCGASRMSFYTGRYASSHGAQGNGFPLRVGEITLGDHLRDRGMACWLIGKTHMTVDAEGMARLGLSPDDVIGARQAECGFDIWVRDDGLWAEGPDGRYDPKPSPYNAYLTSRGYDGDNPWVDYANAGVDDDGAMATGWVFANADKPANIREEDSETAWLTTETLRFLEQASAPWCAHVSYIKPHWPYIAPAPYHALYGPGDVAPAQRHPAEQEDPHPVYGAFMANKIAAAFQQDAVRKKVIPAYMGLIAQCDAHLGRLLDRLEATGQLAETMIVLTSDHGDYLGDHWLGEKDLFHAASVKVPLIVYDPRAAANDTRGTTCDALVEAIDVTATLVDVACAEATARTGGERPPLPTHILEGRSLIPWLRGEAPAWREVAISEYDYSVAPMAAALGVESRDARLFMVFDGRYKLVHAEGGFRPMLFDVEADPDEFHDLAKAPTAAASAEIDRLYGALRDWGLRMSQRVTRSEADLAAMRGRSARRGILPFLATGDEVPPELTERYRGPARQRYAPEAATAAAVDEAPKTQTETPLSDKDSAPDDA